MHRKRLAASPSRNGADGDAGTGKHSGPRDDADPVNAADPVNDAASGCDADPRDDAGSDPFDHVNAIEQPNRHVVTRRHRGADGEADRAADRCTISHAASRRADLDAARNTDANAVSVAVPGDANARAADFDGDHGLLRGPRAGAGHVHAVHGNGQRFGDDVHERP